jgi:hypothetical protein
VSCLWGRTRRIVVPGDYCIGYGLVERPRCAWLLSMLLSLRLFLKRGIQMFGLWLFAEEVSRMGAKRVTSTHLTRSVATCAVSGSVKVS